MENMTSVEAVKAAIRQLYETDPHIHIDISMKTPKLSFYNDAVKITGVYRNLFQIEEYTADKPQRHTLPYSEVLIGHIVIRELGAG